MKKTLCILFGLAAAAVVAEPRIADVIVRQDWPRSGTIVVDYRLLGVGTDACDVKVAVRCDGEELTLPEKAIVGERYSLKQSGDYRLTIDPSVLPATLKRSGDFQVTLSVEAADPAYGRVLYRVYSLTGDKKVENLTGADILSGKYGSFETDYAFAGTYEAPEKTIIWTGVTNDVYKTDKLAMRYCPAGSFRMAALSVDPGTAATLQKPYFIGVFEMTQAQVAHFDANFARAKNQGGLPYYTNATCSATRPMGNVTFVCIRGQNGLDWPTVTVPSETTYIGQLRKLTGDATFDLPTEARWEYASHAGTTTWWNNGGTNHTTPGGSNVDALRLSRGKANGGLNGSELYPGDCGLACGTAAVGSYLPNPWGIYDMHGNVSEWCLDRWVGATTFAEFYGESVVDPAGNTSDEVKNVRCLKGSNYTDGVAGSSSDRRSSASATTTYVSGTADYAGKDVLGFRVICEAAE